MGRDTAGPVTKGDFMKLRLLTAVCVVATCAVGVSSAAADPFSGPPICTTAGTPLTGAYESLTVTGDAYVPAGSSLYVAKNLNLAPGSCLDAYSTGTVDVGRNLVVGRDAVLGLGCAPFEDGEFDPCGETTTDDVIGGNLSADNPLTMYLSADTINGNLTSVGGGPGVTFDPYVNFPIKDSTIRGNVSVSGWQGAWFGFLRNTVGHNAVFSGISAADPDSNEIATNTVAGNLICQDNSPAAQTGDSGGTPNTVGHRNIGCP